MNSDSPSKSSAPPDAAADFAFETGDFMKATMHIESKIIPDKMSETGAFGPVNRSWEKTKSGRWEIQEQRVASAVIAAGIAFEDRSLVDCGLKIIEWGFEQQSEDGSFSSPESADKYHGTSFFIEATAHSLLLLERSSLQGELKRRTDLLKTKLLRAARWMIRPDIDAAAWNGKTAQRFFGHRRFLVAAALGESGVLCGDEELISKSKNFLRSGLEIQLPNGVIPEKGGYDSHYQAQAMLLAARYFVIVADTPLRAEMKPAVDRGIEWLRTRIKSDGTVNAKGNARAGVGKEKTPAGLPKDVNYTLVYRALYYWGMLTENSQLKNLAQKVFEADRRRKNRVPKKNFWSQIFGKSK